ncbi:hypothetical protein LXL04_007051 [Taraxacum kok-saghyz]
MPVNAGIEIPQAEATFLAFGELMYCPRLGFFAYPQKQGCCAFNLLQQATEGFAPLERKAAHGNNSCGLQVAAFDFSTLFRSIISKTLKTTKENTFFIIFLIEKNKLEVEMERTDGDLWLVQAFGFNLENLMWHSKCSERETANMSITSRQGEGDSDIERGRQRRTRQTLTCPVKEETEWSPKNRWCVTGGKQRQASTEWPEERVVVGVAGNGKSQSTSEWPETRSPSRRNGEGDSDIERGRQRRTRQTLTCPAKEETEWSPKIDGASPEESSDRVAGGTRRRRSGRKREVAVDVGVAGNEKS